MICGHQCFEIGGPWIAEDPSCPIHGAAATGPRLVIDSTFHERGTPSLASLKVWDCVPGSAHEDLKALTQKFLEIYPGLDIHIEIYMLRGETRRILEKS